MLAYSDGSQFRFAGELQSIWLVRWAMRSRTPHPYPTHPFPPHCVKSSTSLLALDEQWGAGHPTPYPTHPFPFSLCEELCMSDNMCISCPPAAVLAYWDPGGLVHFFCFLQNISVYILNTELAYSLSIHYIELFYILSHRQVISWCNQQ